LERKAAYAFFGEEPPSVTYEEALEHLLRAEEYKKDFIRNCLWIGNCFVKLGQKEKAREWYQKGLDIPAISEDDRQAHEELKQLLKKL
jgi:tetratricopeptide (TPR) repeat protein